MKQRSWWAFKRVWTLLTALFCAAYLGVLRFGASLGRGRAGGAAAAAAAAAPAAGQPHKHLRTCSFLAGISIAWPLSASFTASSRMHNRAHAQPLQRNALASRH